MGRLLVTGQSGLVGSQFKGDLIALSSKVCDLRDKKSTETIHTRKMLESCVYKKYGRVARLYF